MFNTEICLIFLWIGKVSSPVYLCMNREYGGVHLLYCNHYQHLYILPESIIFFYAFCGISNGFKPSDIILCIEITYRIREPSYFTVDYAFSNQCMCNFRRLQTDWILGRIIQNLASILHSTITYMMQVDEERCHV